MLFPEEYLINEDYIKVYGDKQIFENEKNEYYEYQYI